MNHKHYSYSVALVGGFWFQQGKLKNTDETDYAKRLSSHKDFRTKTKVESFLRSLASQGSPFEVEVYSKLTRMVYYIHINK